MGPEALDPILHQPTRMRIMGALYRNRRLGHVALRDALALTDGNVATHIRKLEGAGYVKAARVLSGLSFSVVYDITPAGVAAFEAYLAALARILDEMR